MANYKLLPITGCKQCTQRKFYNIHFPLCNHPKVRDEECPKGKSITVKEEFESFCPLNNFVKEAA